MLVVKAQEFRSNQGRYLRTAKKGTSFLLSSRYGNFRITPIDDDIDLLTNGLKSACAEIKSHLSGDIQLPNAKDVVF